MSIEAVTQSETTPNWILRHALNDVLAGGEFTLCGMAFDAFDSGDAEQPIVMAAPGETVTCSSCKLLIQFCKKFKRYRQPA